MSHFECRLNRRFWRSKKVVRVLQIGGRGGGNLDEIQKGSNFFRETFPKQPNIDTFLQGFALLLGYCLIRHVSREEATLEPVV